jgi:hypothetical protein
VAVSSLRVRGELLGDRFSQRGIGLDYEDRRCKSARVWLDTCQQRPGRSEQRDMSAHPSSKNEQSKQRKDLFATCRAAPKLTLEQLDPRLAVRH